MNRIVRLRPPALRTFLGLLAAMFLSGGLAADTVPFPVRVALMQGALTQLNENDAKAAIGAMSQRLASKYGHHIATTVELYQSPAELRQAVVDGRIQVVMSGVWDLLSAGIEDRLEISHVSVVAGASQTRWLVLVRRDNPVEDLAAMRGRSLRILHSSVANFGLPWIETRLLELGRHDAVDGYFRPTIVSKPSAAVLPVFFGHADACLVDEASWQTLQQLNPQVGHQLRAVEASAPLPNTVIALARTGWGDSTLRTDAMQQFSTLSEDPVGRQLLLLFRSDRLVPYQPGDLRAAIELHQRHQALLAPAPAP